MTSPATDASGRSLPSTAHSSSRPSHAASISTLRSYWKASSSAALRSAARFTLLIPIDDPSALGLTNTGIAKFARQPRPKRRSVAVVGAIDREISHHRDAGVAQQALLRVLVHPDRRAEHARAHVWDSRQLEQPLHRAVLAVGAVQHREHHVERARNRICMCAPLSPRAAVCRRRDQRLSLGMRQQGDLRAAGAERGKMRRLFGEQLERVALADTSGRRGRSRSARSRTAPDPSPTSRSARSAAKSHARSSVRQTGRRP